MAALRPAHRKRHSHGLFFRNPDHRRLLALLRDIIYINSWDDHIPCCRSRFCHIRCGNIYDDLPEKQGIPQVQNRISYGIRLKRHIVHHGDIIQDIRYQLLPCLIQTKLQKRTNRAS